MDGLLIACGSGFALMGLAGLISYVVSEKRRRTAKAMGTSPAMIFSVVGVGGLFVAAGMVHSGWLYLMGWAWSPSILLRLGGGRLEGG